MKPKNILILSLMLLALLLTGCQVVVVHVYPSSADDLPDCITPGEAGMEINLSLYKSNAGHDNKLNQVTDTQSTIPASVLGVQNSETEKH